MMRVRITTIEYLLSNCEISLWHGDCIIACQSIARDGWIPSIEAFAASISKNSLTIGVSIMAKIERFIVKTAQGNYLQEYFVFPVTTNDRGMAIELTRKQWAKIEAIYAASPDDVKKLTPFTLESK